MRYPYTRLSPSVPLRPYLRIILRNGFATTSPLYALVDSGADYSIFPSSISRDFLALNLNDAEVWTFQGTTGKLQMAYLATIEINVMNESLTKADFQFTAKVGFCEDFRFGGGVLLGQSGFMSEFKTTFSQPDSYFEIEPFQPSLLQRL